MKFSLSLILLVFAFSLTAFGQNGGSLSGKLLKANGKPLPYTEIELVPVAYNKQIIDNRFWAISDASGDYSFSNIPNGKYTLSINFDEKPTDTSPYPTYFYPSNSRRIEAETFEIYSGKKISGINFRVPPPLVQRKVTGKVVGSDGKTIAGAFVYLRDVEYDTSLILDVRTDKSGSFTLSGFESRKYQIGALLYEQVNTSILDSLGNIIAAGYSPVFTLAATNPHFTLVVEESEERKRLREKNVGMLFLR